MMLNTVERSRLYAEGLSVSYGNRTILPNLDIAIPDTKITVIIGPNACGKSTLLRSLARLKSPSSGQVVLDGKNIAKWKTRKVAQTLGILPQMPSAPEGIRVFDLVERGRTPYQSIARQWSKRDAEAVQSALEMTDMLDHADRFVQDLSGGQRQRAWIAMALAQETELLLLDEPTTFLDLSHQIDVLNLIRRLNRDARRTVVMVLHDINLAARYADHLIALKDGAVIVEGSVQTVVTENVIEDVFDMTCKVLNDPFNNSPIVIPV